MPHAPAQFRFAHTHIHFAAQVVQGELTPKSRFVWSGGGATVTLWRHATNNWTPAPNRATKSLYNDAASANS